MAKLEGGKYNCWNLDVGPFKTWIIWEEGFYRVRVNDRSFKNKFETLAQAEAAIREWLKRRATEVLRILEQDEKEAGR